MYDLINKNTLKIKLFFIFINCIWILPSLFLMHINFVNSFIWVPLARAALISSVGIDQLSEFSTNELMLYILHVITGISFEKIAFTPIGAIIVPLCYFVFSKKIFKSVLLGIIFSVYAAYDFSVYPGHFSTFSYAWGRTLFLCFLIIFISYLYKKENWGYGFLFLPVFLAINFLHVTYAYLVIIFVLTINSLIYIFNFFNKTKVDYKLTFRLSFSLLVVFLGFNQIIYKLLGKKLSDYSDIEIISNEFVPLVRQFLGMSQSIKESYSVSIAPPTQLIGYSAFIRTLLIFLIIIIFGTLWFKQNYKNILEAIDNDIILIIGLLILGIGQTLAYSVYGHASLRFVAEMFPIVSVFLLTKLNYKYKYRTILVLIISLVFIALAFIQSGSFIIENVNNLDNTFDNVRYGSIWLMVHSEKPFKLLASSDTYHYADYYGSNLRIYSSFLAKNYSFEPVFYNSEIYSRLVDPRFAAVRNKISKDSDYILINNNSEMVMASWKKYEPLSIHFKSINRNINVAKIFDDKYTYIYIT